ncbi:hypothetical protein TNCV_877071 [Trichonephila clavipes]|nr:hypothetical protein TNCV_877071 [Trichonephila clavipes]
MQMEVIEIQCDSNLKAKFVEVDVPEFYKYLPATFENTGKFADEIISMSEMGDWLTNRSVNEHFHETFLCSDNEHIRITNTFKKDFLCLDNEHIFGSDQEYTPGIMDEILTTARDLELEVKEDDIEELIMGHEDELTTEEVQEILNKEHQ